MPLFDIAVVGNFVTMTDHETKFEIKGQTQNLGLEIKADLMRILDVDNFKKASWTDRPVPLDSTSPLYRWYTGKKWLIELAEYESHQSRPEACDLEVEEMEED